MNQTTKGDTAMSDENAATPMTDQEPPAYDGFPSTVSRAFAQGLERENLRLTRENELLENATQKEGRATNGPVTTEDQTLTIPAGAVVVGSDFCSEGPYIEYILADDINGERIRAAAPNALAYYLRTHGAGASCLRP